MIRLIIFLVFLYFGVSPIEASAQSLPLVKGQQSLEILIVQEKLSSHFGYDMPVTGYYGVITAENIKHFQITNGIELSREMIDKETWFKLFDKNTTTPRQTWRTK